VQFLKRRLIFKNNVSGICGYYNRMRLGKIYLWELMKLHYAARFGFYTPGPNWPHVPE
jgi:hypothetical protein